MWILNTFRGIGRFFKAILVNGWFDVFVLAFDYPSWSSYLLWFFFELKCRMHSWSRLPSSAPPSPRPRPSAAPPCWSCPRSCSGRRRTTSSLSILVQEGRVILKLERPPAAPGLAGCWFERLDFGSGTWRPFCHRGPTRTGSTETTKWHLSSICSGVELIRKVGKTGSYRMKLWKYKRRRWKLGRLLCFVLARRYRCHRHRTRGCCQVWNGIGKDQKIKFWKLKMDSFKL